METQYFFFSVEEFSEKDWTKTTNNFSLHLFNLFILKILTFPFYDKLELQSALSIPGGKKHVEIAL